jgi:ABC-type amino acid transport substrate-binding protein
VILAFVVLPGLVSTLTGIPLRMIFSQNRDVLITAIVAGDLFIVLPGLIDACGQILSKHAAATGTQDERHLPEIIVPVSFNFPHTGKLLSISFVLFAGWLSDAVIAPWEYPRLALTGLLTFFGSLNAAVPFLLDVFRIPADTFQLFVATSVINSRFGTLLAVVHTIAVALLGSAAIAGSIRFDKARLLRYVVTVAIATAAAIGGMRVVFTKVLPVRFDGASTIRHMQPLYANTPAVVLQGEAAASAAGTETGSVTAAVLQRGTLRVGYFPNRMPYAFQNAEGQLIGLDVERAHSLAADLGVKAVFIELHTSELESAMESGRCDIIMTGALVTPRRQLKTLFSQSYLDETLAFLVVDHRRDEFLKWDDIRHKPGLRIAAPDLPHYLSLLKDMLPHATVAGVDPDKLTPDENAEVDAYVVPAERGSTLTLLHPKFTVVVPEPGLIKVPLAYPIAKRDREWAEVVNSWIELRQKDGTFQALYRHWILGQQSGPREPRWSVLRNILHWAD